MLRVTRTTAWWVIPLAKWATLPVQVLRPGQLGGQRKSPRGVGQASPNDAAVLQLILNGIGHIDVRCRQDGEQR